MVAVERRGIEDREFRDFGLGAPISDDEIIAGR